jgi:threonine/homoserine/homoserine lactone efflux protein
VKSRGNRQVKTTGGEHVSWARLHRHPRQFPEAAVPDLQTLIVFAAAAVVFAVVPGPAVFYVVTRSVAQGRTAGLASAAAIEVGNLVHVAAAMLGVSAVLAASATAFTVVKYLGSAYLVYLGVRALLDRDGAKWREGAPPQPLRRVVAQGIVVSVLNPKTALFFLAFLPQFVDPSRGPVPLQIGVLGVLLATITWLSDSTYALVTGAAGNWLRGNRRIRRAQRFATGGAYLTLGAFAALADPHPASR